MTEPRQPGDDAGAIEPTSPRPEGPPPGHPGDIETRLQSQPGLKPQVPAPGSLAWDDPASPGAPAPGAGAAPGAEPSAPEPPAPEPSGSPAPPPPLPPGPPRWEPPQRDGERYPMRFDVRYPERLSRWKTFLRGFLIIPALIFWSTVGSIVEAAVVAGFAPVFLKRKYPMWLFRAGTGAIGFGTRVAAYGLLLTDRYPSFSPDESPVVLEYDEPPQGQLSRWRVFFWKLLLIVPHFFVLWFLFVAVFAVTVIAWFAILFTGRYPRGLFGFVTGVMRWYLRTVGYFASYTDRFPPFALSRDAGPGSNGAAIACGVLGVLMIGGFGSLVAIAAIAADDRMTEEVSYDALLAGETTRTIYTGSRDNPTFTVRLDRARDPDTTLNVEFDESRQVAFAWTIYNGTSRDEDLEPGAFRLRYEEDDGDREWVDAAFITVDLEPPPATLDEDEQAIVRAVFVIPEDARPLELRFAPPWPATSGITYRFE